MRCDGRWCDLPAALTRWSINGDDVAQELKAPPRTPGAHLTTRGRSSEGRGEAKRSRAGDAVEGAALDAGPGSVGLMVLAEAGPAVTCPEAWRGRLAGSSEDMDRVPPISINSGPRFARVSHTYRIRNAYLM